MGLRTVVGHKDAGVHNVAHKVVEDLVVREALVTTAVGRCGLKSI